MENKEYYLIKTGETIPKGKNIEKIEKVETPFGLCKRVTTIVVNESTIPILIKEGIIAERNIEVKDLSYYTNKLAKKKKWSYEDTELFLSDVYALNKAAVLNIMLKTIAVEMDKKYSDYIADSPEIYVVSVLNGNIIKMDKKAIKNYRNFAAFRTLEEAKEALKICAPILEDMFDE